MTTSKYPIQHNRVDKKPVRMPAPPAQVFPKGSGLSYAELRQIVLEQLG